MPRCSLFLAKPLWFATSLALLPLTSSAAPLRVAFVFDDGPDPVQAERLLKVLADADARVSFSYVGKNVDAHPELARLAFAAGHELNNHSYNHPNLPKEKDGIVAKELKDTSAAIQRATGTAPAWFWAPYLATDERVDRFAREAGCTSFPMASFRIASTDDWNTKTDAATIFRKATEGITDRTVILCHEWRKETVDQMPAILASLRAQGATFLTFSELVKTAP